LLESISNHVSGRGGASAGLQPSLRGVE
jgi:hypothetical protein